MSKLFAGLASDLKGKDETNLSLTHSQKNETLTELLSDLEGDRISSLSNSHSPVKT